MNRLNFTAVTLTACMTMACLGTGCAVFPKDSDQPRKPFSQRMPWSKSDKDKPPKPYPNPVKLAAVWSPETLTQAGRVPTRGFGARVFFYDEKSRPVPVDGTLIVHGFNEENPTQQPDVKRYEFTPEQFTNHFSRSDLGASYSVWIPWDAVGNKQQRVSLVASFKTAKGDMLQGSPTTVLLPGAKTDRDLELAQRFSPEYRDWQAAASGKTRRTSGLTTTTIQRSSPSTPSIVDPSSPMNLPGLPGSHASGPWNIASNHGPLNSVDVTRRRSEDVPILEDRPSSDRDSLKVLPASAKIPRRL